MIQVAPYYLLDSNSNVADTLYFDPASAELSDLEVAYGTGVQGEFRSNMTDNSALMTLVVHYLNLHFISVSLTHYGSFAILTMDLCVGVLRTRATHCCCTGATQGTLGCKCVDVPA